MRESPQTYKTILGEIYSSTDTRARILRRKLNKDFYSGFVSKCIVPGIGTKCMFYPIDKSYTIFIVSGFPTPDVYYCYDYKSDTNTILLKSAWILEDTQWRSVGDVIIRRDKLKKIL